MAFAGGGNDFPPLLGLNNPAEEGYWVSLETVNHEKTAAQLQLFTVKKFLEQNFPGTHTARPTREGKLMILAKNKKIALQATKIKKFYNECDVSITAMDTMNYRQGSIYGREVLSCTIDEMETNLKNQHVVKVERAMSMKDGVLTPNGLHILTFDTTRLPDEIYIGYMRYNVRTYYPRPLRCSKCCIFGHSRKRCEAREEACRSCDQAVHQGSICTGKYCRNCKKSDHGSFDKGCPTFETEVAIVRLKVDKNISYGQARALLSKEIQRSTDSYINSTLERLQVAARERASQSEIVQEAIEKDRRELAEIEADLKKLEETNRKLVELLQKRDAMRRLNQTLSDSLHHTPESFAHTSTMAPENESNLRSVPYPTNSSSTSTPISSSTPTTDPTKDEMMEVVTNLKRKNKTPPSSSTAKQTNNTTKQTGNAINVTTYNYLNPSQKKQLEDLAKGKKSTDLAFFISEDQKVIAMQPKNNTEKQTTRKLLQWISFNEPTEEELSEYDKSL
jgi:Arc/MetJ-type ribon-helix-helix transcriptional regulator